MLFTAGFLLCQWVDECQHIKLLLAAKLPDLLARRSKPGGGGGFFWHSSPHIWREEKLIYFLHLCIFHFVTILFLEFFVPTMSAISWTYRSAPAPYRQRGPETLRWSFAVGAPQLHLFTQNIESIGRIWMKCLIQQKSNKSPAFRQVMCEKFVQGKSPAS